MLNNQHDNCNQHDVINYYMSARWRWYSWFFNMSRHVIAITGWAMKAFKDGLLIWRLVLYEMWFLECGPSDLVFIFALTPNQTWKSVCRLQNNANESCSQCHLISTCGLWFYFLADQEETTQAVAQAAGYGGHSWILHPEELSACQMMCCAVSFHWYSVLNRTGQCGGCCIHTGSLQHVKCLNQCRRYSRSVLIFAAEERKSRCEISPRRTALHFFHLLQIQDPGCQNIQEGPIWQKNPWPGFS